MKYFLVLIFCCCLSYNGFSQINEPSFVQKGDLVFATYYHDNGQIQQEGAFKNGKLHGIWTSYDINGNKLALGNYTNGIKTGKWLFWQGEFLKEVEFKDSRIVSVHEWNDKNKLVIQNQ